MRGEKTLHETLAEAYEKLKYFTFHDKSLVYLKKRICQFERDQAIIQLDILADAIIANDLAYFDQFFDDIKFHTVPKNFAFESDNLDFFTSNVFRDSWENYDSNAFLDLPIELHIINILWITKSLAHLLPSNNEHSFGFILDRDSTLTARPGKKLFKPYYKGYQSWLVGASKAAKSLASQNKSFVLINLDIRRFFYNVQINISNLTAELSPHQELSAEQQLIHKLNLNFHRHWTRLQSPGTNNDSEISLPLGILSSGVLANWYLHRLDKGITNTLDAQYYGRYVDDILLVVPLKRRVSFASKNDLVQKILIEKEIIFQKNANAYGISGYSNLELNSDKLKAFVFHGKESLPQINKIFKELVIDSSEMNLLPDVENIFSKFDDFPYDLQSNELSPKLRDVQAVVSDKFRVSKLLSKALSAHRICDLSQDEKRRMILGFQRIFKGKNLLELRPLWFKYMVLLVSSDRLRNLEILLIRFHQVITLMAPKSHSYHEIKASLIHEFVVSMVMAFSPNIPLFLRFKGQSANKLKAIYEAGPVFTELFKVEGDDLIAYRKSYLVDVQYFRSPAIFLLLRYVDPKENLYRIQSLDYAKESFCPLSNLRFFPRYLKHWDIYQIIFLKTIMRHKKGQYDQKKIATISTKLLWRVSFRRFFTEDFLQVQIQQNLGKFRMLDDTKNPIEEFQLPDSNFTGQENLPTLNVAIPNIRITPGDVMRMLRGRRSVPHAKYAQFREILNDAVKANVNMIVFPELSVPQALVGLLIKYANDFGIGIIAGLEYVLLGNNVLNIAAVILPSKGSGFDYSSVYLRVKNHYSPEEIEAIQARALSVPVLQYNPYHLYVWRGIKFTVFNCFELANIADRSLFKGRIDILFTVLHNRDRFYYESIAQSAVRDLHCYLVHVNTSIYKGTFIIQPTSSVHMYIAEIKGGINTTFICETLDITALRASQAGQLSKTMAGIDLKPRPPDFHPR